MFIQVPQSNPLNVTNSDKPTGPFGFFMADLNDGNPTINGVNVAYVADDEMGIARYDYTSSGWQFSYYINSTGSFLNSAYTVDGDGNVTATDSFNPTNPAASADPTKAGGVRELTGRVVNGQVQLFAVTGFGTGSRAESGRKPDRTHRHGRQRPASPPSRPIPALRNLPASPSRRPRR